MQKPSRRQYLFSVSIFFFFILFGYFFAKYNFEKSRFLLGELNPFFSEGRETSGWQIFIFIFINNSVKAFLSIVLGFLFGIMPVFLLITNGFLIGLVIRLVVPLEGWAYVMAALLPHGVLEIPAIIISATYGLWIGVNFIKMIRTNNSKDVYYSIRKSLGIFFKVILPIVFIAALIETFVTPKIMVLFVK